MLSDYDKQRLQAGFDGELAPREWQRIQEEFRDSAEAAAYLEELEALRRALDAAPQVPVPTGLAESIKRQIPEHGTAGDKVVSVAFGKQYGKDARAGRQGAAPRPAVNLTGGLALAASLVLAVGLGVQLFGVSELGTDSQTRSRMTGTLLDTAAMEAQQHWQWQGMDARATLTRSENGLTLDLELEADAAADVVLVVSGGQWRWRQDATSALYSEGRNDAETSPRVAGQDRLRLAANGKQRYRLELEPATREGDSAQGSLPAPSIGVVLKRGGQLLDQGTIVPD